MAEYYPLLAKAVGNLPSSTPDTRRVIYERARKALIGQMRTRHPPVPEEDIEHESVELDRAVERLEAEIARGAGPAASPPPAKPPPTADTKAADFKAAEPRQAPLSKPPAPSASASTGPEPLRTAPRPPALPERKPTSPRPPLPKPVVPRPARPAAAEKVLPPGADAEPTAVPRLAGPPSSDETGALALETPPPAIAEARVEDARPVQPRQPDAPRPLKPPQRPIAPQPPGPPTVRRRLWIIPAVVALVVALIAVAAWKLRDRPETLARKPAEQTQSDSGKIAERVGGPGPSTPAPTEEQSEAKPAAGEQAGSTPPKPSANPEVPVARRAALLVEAPDEPNKVKTFVGNVVWKLNNAPQDANAAVGLAVEADVDLPDDKLKAIVTFEKNSDASLPASHTIKVRFITDTGSFTGGVKQISVPQMRPEASPNGEPLAGVTVQIVPNSFLVGLSPGNAEAANTDLMRRLQWVDVPMLLESGKIAKLTFEKGDSGQRDLNEAFEAWQK